ncbi:MAG TPA: hypothetical protein VN680_02495 [Burkholderiaceae bacterium]|nr:hypothetical protein [Burkholderiaceae bacterium]
MADTIERLYKLTVDGSQAARSLHQVEQSAAAMDKRMADTIKGIEKFGKSLAAAVSVGAIINGFKQIIDSMDQLAKDSQKVGVSAEELQKLRYAADLSGVSAEQLDQAISKLAVNMGKLGDEGSEAGKSLKKMGVESGDSALTALKKISDQVAKMPDGMEKLALVTEQFGKAAGADMIPLLNAGGQALEDLANEADRYGGVLSGSVITQAEAFNDNLSRLQRTATGATAQLTAGMLPALRAFSQSLVDSTQKGDGFVSTGEKIGELLLNVYGFALKAVSTLQAFGLVLAAVAAAATNPTQAATIFEDMVDQINQLEKDTNTTLANMRANLAKFKAEAAAAPSKGPSGQQGESASVAADKLAASTKAAAKAADEHRKAEELRWKELIRAAGVEEELQKTRDAALTERNAQLTAYQRAIVEVDAASKNYLDTIEQEGARLQYLIDLTDETSDVYANSTEGQRAYARAQLATATTTQTATETLVKQQDELDVLTDGFNNFFENLARGTASVEDLFKRMVQSIIAELLKLWARKYIVEAIFGVGYSPGGKSGGQPRMMATSSGPTSGPTGFASSTAVGADISPVRFGVAGVQGVPTQQAPAPTMQVTINNNAPNTKVDTRQTPAGLEVIVSQVKASLTADVLRGGNDYANAHERAFGLSRGSAAAF